MLTIAEKWLKMKIQSIFGGILMNYSALLKGLTNEMKKHSNLKTLPILPRILLTIIFIPIFIAFFFSKIGFWFTMFLYKMISAPADHLHKWLTEQKDGVQHITQAVMYFVCLPTIFGFQVVLSFNAISFYLQWFGIQIQAFILTLGGVRWQPFVTEAVFDEN